MLLCLDYNLGKVVGVSMFYLWGKENVYSIVLPCDELRCI